MVAFGNADLALNTAIRASFGSPCTTRETFLRLMQPAQAAAQLLPADDALTSQPYWLLSYLNATGAKGVKQLLLVLAWTSRDVVPWRTPAGMDSIEPLRIWTVVAQRCAIAMSSIIPRLSNSEEVFPQVLQASEGSNLPGGWRSSGFWVGGEPHASQASLTIAAHFACTDSTGHRLWRVTLYVASLDGSAQAATPHASPGTL
jgi:hypothetical protein